MASFEVDMADSIHKAYIEISSKSLHDIQKETAITWSGRAIAAYHLYSSSGRIRNLMDSQEYAHEALEHASLAGPDFYLQVANCLRELKY